MNYKYSKIFVDPGTGEGPRGHNGPYFKIDQWSIVINSKWSPAPGALYLLYKCSDGGRGVIIIIEIKMGEDIAVGRVLRIGMSVTKDRPGQGLQWPDNLM